MGIPCECPNCKGITETDYTPVPRRDLLGKIKSIFELHMVNGASLQVSITRTPYGEWRVLVAKYGDESRVAFGKGRVLGAAIQRCEQSFQKYLSESQRREDTNPQMERPNWYYLTNQDLGIIWGRLKRGKPTPKL